MNKIFILLVFFLFSFSAYSKPIVLSFNRIDLNIFLDATYGQILKKNFVLSPDLINQSRKITVSINIDDSQLISFMASFLDRMQISQIEKQNVLFFYPKLSNTLPITQNLNSFLPRPEITSPIEISKPTLLDSNNNQNSAPKSDPEFLPLSFKVFKPSNTTPDILCDSINKVFINSCYSTSSASILTHVKHLDLISDLAEELDIRPMLIDISSTFVEVSGSKRDGYGVNLLANVLGGSLGVNLGASVDTSTINIKGPSLTVLLDILKTDGRFKQVARPSGRVSSGSPFNIIIGDEVPTLSGQSRDTTGQVTSQVLYRSSGVILNILPTAITKNDVASISANVDAQISSFSETKSGVNGSPTLTKRQIKTTLLFDENQVVLLGGLTGSRSTSSRSSLFGINLNSRDDDQSIDLVLLITARVIK